MHSSLTDETNIPDRIFRKFKYVQCELFPAIVKYNAHSRCIEITSGSPELIVGYQITDTLLDNVGDINTLTNMIREKLNVRFEELVLQKYFNSIHSTVSTNINVPNNKVLVICHPTDYINVMSNYGEQNMIFTDTPKLKVEFTIEKIKEEELIKALNKALGV